MILISCLLASKSGAQEITVRGSESHYCFDGLTPDTLYNATVYTQTPNLEGPGVSVKDRTCKIRSSIGSLMQMYERTVFLHKCKHFCNLPASFELHSFNYMFVGLLCLAVVKPTEVPTEPPPPPAPATVPAALDGEGSFKI